MNASPRVPLRPRTVAAVAALILGLFAVLTTYLVSQNDVSGADSGKSTKFTVVGDGSLPTKKPKLGADRAPLSAEETGYAIYVASKDSSVGSSATSVTGKKGPEFLYADIPDFGQDLDGRIAVVSLYDYTDGVAYDQLVDLGAGKVIKSTKSSKVQPPTSTTEADTAISIAIDSDAKLPFKTEFEESEGVPLIEKDQVEYVAGAWVYDETSAKGKECGTDRCAQLMISTASGVYLNTADFVVNLSKKTIVATQ